MDVQTVGEVTSSPTPANTVLEQAVAPVAREPEVDVQPTMCANCAAAQEQAQAAPHFVYALGRIEPRFPNASLEREFAQATARTQSSGLTDSEVLHEVLGGRENRYLVRQMCWLMTIQGLETYILKPRDPADFELLAETLRPQPGPGDLDCVIGVYGPIAPPELCGLSIPIVGFDQIYSFNREDLVKSIPRPEGVTAKVFGPAASELFDRMIQMTDNAGATDEDRALNYLAVRYDAIYASAADAFARNASLTSVAVTRSRLSGTRNVLDVILSYTDRATDVTDQVFIRVDVTEEFPFLVTKLSPYYER
jgi:hypothetical protein